ncbi:ABC transporter ATP-binding protein [Hamadaea tsunoensis]|uniref:ABC transporter ATP-binding protein n=1 Tax=Hamadaea tsunoensis TaxID=53368 RepID=UPI001B7FB852|nr:ABC transporter ATP-binding protein [Hamadaea tsunoensis]
MITSAPVVELADVRRAYRSGDTTTVALDGVSLSVGSASFTAVMGPSGSGKSTLLQCAAGLDRADSGRVVLAGLDLGTVREPRLTVERRTRAGFVFQAYNLIDALTVEENVLLPQRLAGTRADRAYAREVLGAVGLGGREKARPAQLSGGQRQRVALARALAGRPAVIFADEPTGALDIQSGKEVLALLRRAVDEFATAVVMVTHDPAAAAWADRVVILADGRIVRDLAAPTAEQVAEHMMAVTKR